MVVAFRHDKCSNVLVFILEYKVFIKWSMWNGLYSIQMDIYE